MRDQMRAGILIGMVVVLALPVVLAGTLGATQPFAQTRSGKVSWQTSIVIEFTYLSVNATELNINGRAIDIQPALSTDNVSVLILQWHPLNITLRVTNTTSTGYTIRASNPGLPLAILGPAPAVACVPTVATCSGTMAAATTSNVYVIDSTILPPTGGGTGPGSGEGLSGGLLDTILPDPPQPLTFSAPQVPEFFTHLSTGQWIAMALGTVMVFGSFPLTAAVLPSFLIFPIPASWSLGLGSVLILGVSKGAIG